MLLFVRVSIVFLANYVRDLMIYRGSWILYVPCYMPTRNYFARYFSLHHGSFVVIATVPFRHNLCNLPKVHPYMILVKAYPRFDSAAPPTYAELGSSVEQVFMSLALCSLACTINLYQNNGIMYQTAPNGPPFLSQRIETSSGWQRLDIFPH